MEERIMQINCFGKMEQILVSLKEVVSKLEEGCVTQGDAFPKEGTRIVSDSENAVLTVIK